MGFSYQFFFFDPGFKDCCVKMSGYVVNRDIPGTKEH